MTNTCAICGWPAHQHGDKHIAGWHDFQPMGSALVTTEEALAIGERVKAHHARAIERTAEVAAKLDRTSEREPVQCVPGCELCRSWAERGAHEIIICAAVLAASGEVIRCHRHHDGLRALADRHLEHAEHEQAQGFVTSRNRYVDRWEAMRIQRAAGIESVAPGGYRGSTLFSEDLY